MLKKTIPIILVSAILVSTFLSSEIITYASCINQNKSQLLDEIKLVDKMLELKSPIEITVDNLNKIRNVGKNQNNTGLSSNLLAKIKNTTLINLKNTETAIEYTINEENNQIIKGIADFHVLFKYEDGTSGYSVDKYNFTFDKNNQEINATLIPELFQEDTLPATPLKITEQEKKDIEIKKSKQLKPNLKTIESIKDEAKKSPKEHFSKMKQDLENKYKCFGLQTKAASGGTYDRNAASSYAMTYASIKDNDVWYNANYFNYNKTGLSQNGSDCASFTSQALFAGGIAKDYGNNSSNDMDWYFHWDYPWYGGRNPVASTTWIRVTDQMTHMYYRENTGPWYQFKYNQYSQFGNLQNGDLIFVDWNGTGNYGHVYIITGWEVINNHWEPRISAHSTNRNNISWQVMLSYAQGQGRNINNINFKGLGFYNYVW